VSRDDVGIAFCFGDVFLGDGLIGKRKTRVQAGEDAPCGAFKGCVKQ
jgi:hypothetical protein